MVMLLLKDYEEVQEDGTQCGLDFNIRFAVIDILASDSVIA